MALHPEIMRRVQSEIDAATGRDRLPTFEDRSRLPFVEAVCKEVLRWRPVTPLGAPLVNNHADIWTFLSSQLSLTQLQKMIFTKGYLYQKVCAFRLVISIPTDPYLCRCYCNRKFMVSRLSMSSKWLQPFLGQSCTTLRDIQSQTSSSQNDSSI